MPVTEKQRAFFAEYAIDQNGTQAAIRAGYAPKSAYVTASRLLKLAKDEPEHAKALAKVHAGIERKVAELMPVAENTAAYAIAKTIEIIEYGTRLRPVIGMFGPIIDPDTNEPVLEMTDPRTAVTALTQLSKQFPEFSEKHEIEAKVGVMLVRQTRGLRGR